MPFVLDFHMAKFLYVSALKTLRCYGHHYKPSYNFGIIHPPAVHNIKNL